MKTKVKFVVTKKDLVITHFSGSGAGGQHRNRHKNCVRIKHPDTGIIVTGQSHKEERANKTEALKNLVSKPKFRFFCEVKLRELETGETVEDAVMRSMAPENLEWIES